MSVLLTLGEIYNAQSEYQLGRDVFRQALALEGNLPPAAMGLGTSCSYLSAYAEAAEVLQGLIKRGMRSLDVLVALADLPASIVTVDLLSELRKLRHDGDRRPPSAMIAAARNPIAN